ncbi:MAG TPA: sulfur oxidation c-type cytochrome SoxA [Hyphomonas adhaerens]|uniref:SoxAX cytochrome complex subunit A n=1 Tax=Hyphomonas adhaerens TaxID=81029 RepID=A0A3B9GXQ1_9PROT|nr:sulfur oxidation c-type cytochrome SoxA [Hyphomonas sp.]HAE27217.1 sulfur oxidation c-type cytochrome SoxA [Hyphomonas adhaerens]|tara:strand:+ start:7734 stop:8522 length:789 start_codon:yes stop_codon:yes gene_type:complete
MRHLSLLVLVLAGCGSPQDQYAQDSQILPADIRSGYEFLQPETQSLQDDDFANPGFLWIDKGEALFNRHPDNGKRTCASCHTEDSRPVADAAAHYPAIDEQTGKLVNLEGRINLCRERYQQLPPLEYESEDLLSLTAYISNLARGVPIAVDITGPARKYFDAGEDYFFLRKGQFNLACSQCHNEHWGDKLRGDTISQGHGNAFPAYRMEWQTFGSLHRRLRDCDTGIRAEPLEYGSETYTAVELYLAKRAEGLAMESPGIRR